MRKWIDQSTFDELLLANVNANMEQAIRSASAVLEAVQAFVPEATLFYHVTHATDSLKNYFEEACTGFRRNGILFLVRKYTYPKTYYELVAIGRSSGMRTTTPTIRLSTSNPNRLASGSSPKRRSTIGWNTSRRVSETSNVSMLRTKEK